MLARYLSPYSGVGLSILRIGAGLLFMMHGAQKLYGFLGPPVPSLFSLLGLAGLLEWFGGLLLVLGLFTRPTALLTGGQMAVAYWMAHLPRGFWPLQNGGEPALLFMLIFLYITVAGPGPLSLDHWRAIRQVAAQPAPAPAVTAPPARERIAS
ncbi:MAG TPA: DoxX family protein [Candidatus Nitrosotenuis sp.]|jgi:putative oxidoreductase|nr:DoxX family protein [Candidatus Nitrosotenuis sp.]